MKKVLEFFKTCLNLVGDGKISFKKVNNNVAIYIATNDVTIFKFVKNGDIKSCVENFIQVFDTGSNLLDVLKNLPVYEIISISIITGDFSYSCLNIDWAFCYNAQLKDTEYAFANLTAYMRRLFMFAMKRDENLKIRNIDDNFCGFALNNGIKIIYKK